MASAITWVENELRRKGLMGMGIRGQVDSAKGESPLDVVELLKACTTQKDLGRGSKLHAYIQEHKILGKNPYIGSTLVNMYAKCGSLAMARQVLKELPDRDAVTWNALMAGYTQQGQGDEALKCFDDMLQERQSPNVVTFTCALKACGSIKLVAKGIEIHDRVRSLSMLEKDIVLGNTLMDMYVKCGALAKAQTVLEELPIRNVVSWNAMIAGFAEQGQGEQALKCFDNMLHEGHSPTAVTFSCALKACGSIRATAKGKEIHDKIVNLGMLEKDIVIGSTLVDMYIKCGALAKAKHVLEELPVRDVVSWSALIAGYAEHGHGEEALKCFDDMLNEGHSPTTITFGCLLKACGSIGATAKGEKIHDKIVSLGILENDIVLGNFLVDMYAKCGALSKAQQVLEELPVRNVFSWNALIAGYAERGQGKKVLKCFDDLLHEGHSPNAATFVCVLKACGSIGAAAKGKEIHDKIVSMGTLDEDIVLGSTLVDMYAKCGALAKAQHVLEELPVRIVGSWNALIAGYSQQGLVERVLKCFEDMLHEGHSPDEVTFACVLKACGNIRAVAKGKEIHDQIANLGILEKDMVLGNTLVAMYINCSAHDKAQRVLEALPFQGVALWNALIAVYAQHGLSLEAINCFEKMQSKRVKPTAITLMLVLYACSHTGVLDHAESYFSEMTTKYGILPNIGHYCCMTDLFGRAGKFDKALSIVAAMPCDKCFPSWVALLGACRKWGEVNIGRLAFERAQYLDKSNAMVYILMTDIYTAAGMREQADNIEVMRVMNKASNKPGYCGCTNAADRML